ncbi:MAG: hypothetical protein Q7R70_07095 [Candidatus Diapherotrites archaeon]|nr:hypothetical protein [Candidatus Diapherotrites archaeon]
MDWKKLLLIVLSAAILGTLIAPFATANTISNFNVPLHIPLNKNLSIYGKYSDVNGNGNVICSFWIFDLKDQNQLIKRLSDEYTFSDGSFSSTYPVTEPLFRRGIDYNVVVYCNTATANARIVVDQKEDIAFGVSPNSLITDFAYWSNAENSFTTVFLGLLFLSFMAFLAYLWETSRKH